jgi:hypothetical protein
VYATRLFPARLFAVRYWPRGSDPTMLAEDFLKAVQARIVQYMPDGLEPVYASGRLVRGDVWEGAVATGVYPPYAQVVDTGSSLLKVAGSRLRVRRQTFSVFVFARDRDEVAEIAAEIEAILDGRVVYWQGGRMFGSIQLDAPGPRLDTTGTGLGGKNVWRKDDSYWAYLVRE